MVNVVNPVFECVYCGVEFVEGHLCDKTPRFKILQKNDKQIMKNWIIWQEGYIATGEVSGAICVGGVGAETFKEACLLKYADDKNFDPVNLTWWGCKLFDNEIDARKSYG